MPNFLSNLPLDLTDEVFETVLNSDRVRIERIVSQGQTSPADGWYDQDDHEWVMVLQGCGQVQFDDDQEFTLKTGDYLHIPAHTRHRVSYTDPDEPTVWLAIHYQP